MRRYLAFIRRQAGSMAEAKDNPLSVLGFRNESLIQAKKLDFDVFNALNVMENDLALKNLKFGISPERDTESRRS